MVLGTLTAERQIEGLVSDSATGQPIEGVNISTEKGASGTSTDKEGRLTWSNANLIELTKRSTNNSNYMLEGFDWISLFKEEDREDVLVEFKSCLSMNRRFIKETTFNSGMKVRLLGYPYKINDTEHGGFLVSITPENEA